MLNPGNLVWQAMGFDVKLRTVRYLAETKDMTAAKIAVELGCTRNAVCGFCDRHRIRLPGKPGAKPKASADAKADVAKRRKKHTRKQKSAPTQATAKPKPKTKPAVPMPDIRPTGAAEVIVFEAPPCQMFAPRRTHKRVGFWDVKPNQCRFPLWGNKRIPINQKFFCGNDTQEGKSFCPGCAVTVYKPRERRDAN